MMIAWTRVAVKDTERGTLEKYLEDKIDRT